MAVNEEIFVGRSSGGSGRLSAVGKTLALLFWIMVGFFVFAVPYVAGLSIQLFGTWAELVVIAAVYLFVAWMIS